MLGGSGKSQLVLKYARPAWSAQSWLESSLVNHFNFCQLVA
jgi:hypothetical protein